MNDTTRAELMEKVSDVIWQGMLPGHEHVSQLREPANATARHIIALVTEARDAAVASAKHPPRRGNGMKETIRDRIKSIANDPHIKERYDMYADMVLGDLREALLSEPDADAVERADAIDRITRVAEAIGESLGASKGPDGYRVYVDWSSLVSAAEAALQAVAVEPEPGLDEMLSELVDDGLPGRTVGIARHDGQWSVQQMMTYMEEEFPMDISGHGDTVAEALAAAARRATEGSE